MKQKGWILLAVLLLLVALTFVRERFEATPTIKAPPYDEAETARIRNMMSKMDLHELRVDMKAQIGDAASDERIEMMMDYKIQRAVETFFKSVYSRASAPITDADISTALERWGELPSNMKEVWKRLLKSYFIDQAPKPIDVTAMPVPGGMGPKMTDLSKATAMPFPTNTTAMPVPGGGMGTLTGSSTGGSSTSSMGPTSGNTGNRSKQVFGPVFTSRGEGGNPGNSGDSTKTNNYPELMGGQSTTASTKIPGAGIVAPSKNWLLTMDGSLPSWDSLGASEMSKYFPTSRTPGDMDLIPDPYRLSRNFSTSSYSSKTEPAPFLTDFSAFLK
jgi:hypothetical protein